MSLHSHVSYIKLLSHSAQLCHFYKSIIIARTRALAKGWFDYFSVFVFDLKWIDLNIITARCSSAICILKIWVILI